MAGPIGEVFNVTTTQEDRPEVPRVIVDVAVVVGSQESMEEYGEPRCPNNKKPDHERTEFWSALILD
jgi:hypothetical protein